MVIWNMSEYCCNSEAHKGPTREEVEATWSTTGATPLHYTQEELRWQREMTRALIERVHGLLGDGVSEEMCKFVEIMVLSRDARHQAKGRQNYNERLNECIEGEPYLSPDELTEVTERAAHGMASPLELLYLRHDVGMGSIELGRVTGDPKLVKDLEDKVGQAVGKLGGSPLYDDPARVKLRTFSIPVSGKLTDKPEAVLITRRQAIAECDGDTRVMRRSSFIVPIRGISSEDRRWLLAFPRDKGVDHWAAVANEDNSELTDRLGLYLDSGLVIPISTTFYAVNQTVLSEQENRRNQRRQAIKEHFEKNHPDIASWRLGCIATHDTVD